MRAPDSLGRLWCCLCRAQKLGAWASSQAGNSDLQHQQLAAECFGSGLRRFLSHPCFTEI